MLAYLANRPVIAKRQSSPNALLLVISAHVALLAVVTSAKMDLPRRIFPRPPIVVSIPSPPPPPPGPMTKQQPQTAPVSTANHRPTNLPTPPDNLPADAGRPPADNGSGGGGTAVIPEPPQPAVAPIHHDARLLTPSWELKPPYPPSKLASEQEAALRLRLTIDAGGRVVAVDPVGGVDVVFLEAARRYLMAHWRYQPATDDGRPIASSITITLRFQLDG